jgi:hypothetical protein
MRRARWIWVRARARDRATADALTRFELAAWHPSPSRAGVALRSPGPEHGSNCSREPLCARRRWALGDARPGLWADDDARACAGGV